MPTLSFRHFLLAFLVVGVWGTNFVVTKIALGQLPPLLLVAFRMTFAFIPMVFFLPRPKVPWQNVALYGLLIGVGQFGLLYIAMTQFISPGMASLVMQTQVFFTIALAMRLANERIRLFQWCALLLAGSGIALIAWHTDGTTSLLGLALVLAAAFSWALANIVAKHSQATNMLAYVAWSNAFSIPPLFALSLIFEGRDALLSGVLHSDWQTWAVVVWQGWANTLFGFAVWAWLLARYPAATISPLSLLVPLFGLGSSVWLLDESLPLWKLLAMALVMAGLALNLFWPRLRAAWF